MISDNCTNKPCSICGYRISEEKHIRWLAGDMVLLLHVDCASRLSGGIFREVRKVKEEQEEERLERLTNQHPF